MKLGYRVRLVLLAYADESGDSGDVSVQGASVTYAVGCVLVDAADWPSGFDGLLAFRRGLRASNRIPVRAEVKAKYLVSGSGTLRPLRLTLAERQAIFRSHLAMLSQLKMRAFAVVVDKRAPNLAEPVDQLAWSTVMERLERTTKAAQEPFALIHDDGNNALVRKVARKARRRITAGSLYGTGQITLAAHRFVDDPVPRDSAQSYLVQMADLVAYAAFRTLVPPSRAVRQVAPADLWNEIGPATHRDVNKYSGGTPGVVVRPR